MKEPVSSPLDFSRRWQGVELMDDPQCDTGQLLRTLDQFYIINRLVSRYQTILKRYVLDDMMQQPDRTYHLLDLGAGGCDIPVWLLKAAAKRSLHLRVTAIDADVRAIDHAKRQCADVPNLTIEHADIMQMKRFEPIDYIFSNHVFHHLPDALIPEVMAVMAATARRVWIISDLYRSPLAYIGFQFFGRCFRNSFSFEDGKRSIRRSFNQAEMKEFLSRAALRTVADVHWLHPGRLIVVGGGRELIP